MVLKIKGIDLMSILTSNSKILIFLGMLSGLAFAPLFLFPTLFTFSVLFYYVYRAESFRDAFIKGFVFGFGHFLTGMYWISIGVSVYIDQFWWAIPFALLGLPLILAFFIGLPAALSWAARESSYFHLVFCLAIVFFEWVRSWIFTGLPWNLLGYSLAFSDALIQPASIFGTYGLSFAVIYISTCFFYYLVKQKKYFKSSAFISIAIISLMWSFGTLRLKNYPTNFSKISIRLVQPSIPQSSKWNESEFWNNLDAHINLSVIPATSPDLIIWSEAALVAPYKYPPIKNKLQEMLKSSKSVLITGGVSDNDKLGDEYKMYTTLQAINPDGNLIFEYHKSHLVPFGEYMPLKNILPIKKLTHGFIDYTPGVSKLVTLQELGLHIKPLICYEAIFPELVRTSNRLADVIINVTNDAWYGNSSGPYQHLHITRLRAVENGLPILRTGNNGISAVIDPLGRIVNHLELNRVGIINAYMPIKIPKPTLYSLWGNTPFILMCMLVLLIQPLITFMRRLYLN